MRQATMDRLAELESDNHYQRKRIAELEAENKALLELLIERDGGTHDADCKIHNPGIKRCNCGHDDVEALLGEQK